MIDQDEGAGLRSFCDMLKAVHFIDRHDFIAFGIITDKQSREPFNIWSKFRKNPYDFIVSTDDVTRLKIWRIIKRRGKYDETERRGS